MGSSSLIQAHLQGWAVSPMESARLDAWPSDRAYRFLGLLLSLCKEGPPPIVAISLREIEAWVDPPEASVAVSGIEPYLVSLVIYSSHDAERVILSCDFQDGPFTDAGFRSCLVVRVDCSVWPLGGALYTVQGDFWNARRSWANEQMDSRFSHLNQFRAAPFKVVGKSLYLVASFPPPPRGHQWHIKNYRDGHTGL
ncbi:unnamed protein product [Prunus armeniaca]|uniref:Uncharacterized protein n=1 Tax=Prunus armeniaca TaxID=36596 RepID=A0A6J5UGV8_PRUAR|nr:unnamed protein product [Prunus armeniaca]